MFGSTIIDVAIGLIFIYFLLSMIASHINEFIAAIFNWRAKDLGNGIRNLLGDPDLAAQVWNHPLVRGLAGGTEKKPSHIPASTFALALFDAIVPEGNNPTAFDKVRTQAATLPEGSAREAILGFLDAANGDLAQARVGVEHWFNAAMDHVTGLYRQRMRWVTLFVAFAVTLVLGVDTFALADSLWREPTLRAAVQGAAQVTQSTQDSAVSGLQDAVNTLFQFNLTIGWGVLPADGDIAGWIKKLVGLGFTTLAVSLGAPFWYNLLKEIGGLRSSGPTSGK